MSSNFSSLRSNKDNLLKKLSEQAKAQDQKSGADERFWKLTIDQKTKLSSAVIRFLPPPKDEDLSWVRLFRHAFKAPNGSWLIENCPTTLQRQCPVCAMNNELWNSGNDADKNIARDRKRKLQYISNILVISDPAKPDNNGKQFLFAYGQKIFEKVNDKMNPEFATDNAVNPFDFWAGANFKLRTRDQGGFVNYDKSEFDNPSALYDGDEAKLEELWLAEKPLNEFGADSAFKSYEDLEKRLKAVLTGEGRAPKTAEEAIKRGQAAARPTQEDAAELARAVQDDDADETPAKTTPAPARGRKPKATAAPVEEKPKADAPDDDEIRDFFKELDN